MKDNLIAITITLALFSIAIFQSRAIEAKYEQLPADALASFLNINHLTFTLKYKSPRKKLNYGIILYKNGKKHCQASSGFGDHKCASSDKVSIIFQRNGERLNIKVKTKITASHTLILPKEARFTAYPQNPIFDKKGRIMLAYDTKPDEKNKRRFSDKDSPETTTWALVFQVIPE